MTRETKCPLCNAPRPRGAKRCICNYTFEYERPSHTSLRTVKSAPAQSTSVLALAIFVTGLAVAYIRLLERAPMKPSLGLLLAPIGVFCIAAAYFNWGFFMRNSRARRVRFFLGSAGVRFFYAVLGGAFTGVGLGVLIA